MVPHTKDKNGKQIRKPRVKTCSLIIAGIITKP